MRNILALVAAFTLSSTSTMSIIACNNALERGTTNVFDWSSAFNDTNTTTADFFDYLLKNPNSGWGSKLYSSINKYINLSILKNDPKYATEYTAALISAKAQVANTINSLKAKFGRSWEKEWKKVLNDQDVNTYIDNTYLKESALSIIQRSYVTNNYQDYKYYSQNEISIWLRDIWEQVKSEHNPDGNFNSVQEYYEGNDKGKIGKYASKVWIVANANSLNVTPQIFTELNTAIKSASSWNNVLINLPVVQRKDDASGGSYQIDSYNTIDGLLSNNQIKIAQVMLRNQEPVWTRQIVVPFDSGTKPLQEGIDESKFKENEKAINDIIKDINDNGFDQTFIERQGKVNDGDITKTGDLGLIDINKSTKENSPFYYYLYRYVTSSQGIGKNKKNNIQPYNLTKFDTTVKTPDLKSLLPYINRENISTETSSSDTTSKFNDLVYMPDKQGSSTILPEPTKNNGPGVGIFIDKDGIHFIQTPGITYTQQYDNKPNDNTSNYDRIKTFKNSSKNTWKDFAPLSERLDGLNSLPYLDYLQTVFLLQKYSNTSKLSFNLNDNLTAFTGNNSDSSGLGDATWWDYNLYFNNNSASFINWNLTTMTGSKPNADDKTINSFVKRMRDWFNITKENRWTNKQGLNLNTTFAEHVNLANKDWDNSTPDTPVARMDLNIKNYLDVIGKNTIWWYDPNIINS